MFAPRGNSSSTPSDAGTAENPYAVRWIRANKPMLVDLLAALGAVVLFSACAYRRIWHADWTGGEALEALWPFYLSGGAAVLVRLLLGDASTEDAI